MSENFGSEKWPKRAPKARRPPKGRPERNEPQANSKERATNRQTTQNSITDRPFPHKQSKKTSKFFDFRCPKILGPKIDPKDPEGQKYDLFRPFSDPWTPQKSHPQLIRATCHTYQGSSEDACETQKSWKSKKKFRPFLGVTKNFDDMISIGTKYYFPEPLGPRVPHF